MLRQRIMLKLVHIIFFWKFLQNCNKISEICFLKIFGTKVFFGFFIGNGYITTAVLREILKELDDKITSDELDMMIDEIDADGSGTVDFDGNKTFS